MSKQQNNDQNEVLSWLIMRRRARNNILPAFNITREKFYRFADVHYY